MRKRGREWAGRERAVALPAWGSAEAAPASRLHGDEWGARCQLGFEVCLQNCYWGLETRLGTNSA